MGNWNITINGIGSHHNESYPKDADKMVQKFVEDLIQAGHTVETATFTYGGREDSLKKALKSELKAG